MDCASFLLETTLENHENNIRNLSMPYVKQFLHDSRFDVTSDIV